MAIIQEGNAVFYHPLESGLETLQTSAWATGNSEFGFARVGDGMQEGFSPVSAAGSWGVSVVGFSGVGLEMAQLDEELFVLVRTGFAVAGRVTGTTISFGTPIGIQLGSTDIVAMSSETFVIVHGISSGGTRATQGRVNRATLAITIVTSTIQGGASTGRLPTVARLDASRAVCVYEEATADEVRISIGTLNPSTLAMVWTSSGLIRAAGSSPAVAGQAISIAALSPDKVVAVWDETAGSSPKSVVVSVLADNSVVVGSNTPYASTTRRPQHGGMVAMNSSTVLLVADGLGFLGTVSGTDISWQSVTSPTGDTGSFNRLARLDSTRVMSVRHQSNGNSVEDEVFARIGTLSGATVSWGPDESIFTGSSVIAASTAKAAAVSIRGNTIVVAMFDATALRAEAGILSRDAAAVGTSGPYPTAVGATRLAYASWTRNPNTTFSPLVDAAQNPHFAVSNAPTSTATTKGMLAYEDGSGIVVRTFETANPGQKVTLQDSFGIASASKPSIDMGVDLAGDGRGVVVFERAGSTVIQSLRFNGPALTISVGTSTSILGALAPSVAFEVDNFVSATTPPPTTTVPPAVDNVLLAFEDSADVKVQQLNIDADQTTIGLGGSLVKSSVSNPSIASGTGQPFEPTPSGHAILATEDGSGNVNLYPLFWTAGVSVTAPGGSVVRTIADASRPSVALEQTGPGDDAVGAVVYEAPSGELELRPLIVDTVGPTIGYIEFGTIGPIGVPGDGIRADVALAWREIDDEQHGIIGFRDHAGVGRLLTVTLTPSTLTSWELSTL